jgi:FtsH-binding integral membrane protein
MAKQLDEGNVTIDAAAAAEIDANGDGHISAEEMAMHLEFKRKALEDKDAQRDAIRKMAWFSLMGLLVYPLGIAATSFAGLDTAATLIADIAPTYFASIAVLVSAFFGADAFKKD